jgi:AhpD family alkylhydroperoxidase
MSARGPIEYRDASAAVRAVFDDIKRTRQVEDVNNFWKYLAHDPATLKRTWESVKEIMAPGALDPLTKEMIYLAVSVTNGCGYCIASHAAAAPQGRHDGSDVRRGHGRDRDGQRNQPPRQRLPRADRSRLRVSRAPQRRETAGRGPGDRTFMKNARKICTPTLGGPQSSFATNPAHRGRCGRSAVAIRPRVAATRRRGRCIPRCPRAR